MDKYEGLKQQYVKYLKDRKAYDSIDLTLIDKIVKLEKLCDEAWDDLEERGLINNIRKKEDDPYMQTSQSFNNLLSSIKIIAALSTKLGLTVLDRTKLKLKAKEGKSELDKLLE